MATENLAAQLNAPGAFDGVMKAASGAGFSSTGFVAGLVFSGVGMIALAYGKKMGDFRKMGLGGALLVYSYLITDAFWVIVIGAVLTAALFVGGET